METFAELLSLYTSQAGIDNSQLARAVGVSRQTIFRWKEGSTSRPNKREDILAISKRLRLQPEERDNLLLAAGFRPEHVVALSSEENNFNSTDLNNEEKNESKSLLVRSGKKRIFLSRRLLILIVIVLVFIVIMALIDWLQVRSYNPFG